MEEKERVRSKIVNNGEIQWRIPEEIFNHLERYGYPEGWKPGMMETTKRKIGDAQKRYHEYIRELKRKDRE